MKITTLAPDNFFYLMSLIGFLVLSYTFYQFFYKIKIRYILFVRLLIIIIFLFLFLEPVIILERQKIKEQLWNIYIDRSMSMGYHQNPSKLSYLNGISDFVKKIKKNNVPFNIYGFSSTIENWDPNKKEINGASTNISSIYKHINSDVSNNIMGAILISDGQVNLGADINKNLDKIKTPIYVIGTGDLDPMIDVQIHSIDVPPVIIKGEEAEFDVTILNYGNIKERANVTLYDKSKLIGSKVINLKGGGTKEKVKFLIKPVTSGEKNYIVKVNILEDEINIKNNKQNVTIHVLKSEYKIAIITGAPNFNTRILKNTIQKNSEYSVDHFIYADKSFRPSLNKFWKESYDLILFDNHPIKENGAKWATYRKAFAKKLISHKSNFGIIYGNNTHNESLEDYLELFDLSLGEYNLKEHEIYDWSFTDGWKGLFPFHTISSNIENDFMILPPLKPGLKIESPKSRVLARFNNTDITDPIILVGEKNDLRYFTWASSGLSSLFYRSQDSNISDIVYEILTPIFNWLLRTKGDKDIYFRTNKNSYQQGELIEFTGKPIIENKFKDEGILNIKMGDKIINSKPLKYNPLKGTYYSNIWASQSGNVNYEIQFGELENSYIVGRGSFQIQESQVELNQVFLNEYSLKKIAEESGGEYKRWDHKNDLLPFISPNSKAELITYSFPLYENIFVIFLVVGLLIIEWVLRRNLGLS